MHSTKLSNLIKRLESLDKRIQQTVTHEGSARKPK